MLIPILIGLAVLVIALVVIISLRPAEFRVARTAAISAPAQLAFEPVNDFKKWPAWSPWEKLDPAMKKTYRGPLAGVGAVYEWVGNRKAGEGRATITESRPGELIRIKLEFMKPMSCTNTSEFSFKQDGNQTAVTWSLTGTNSFVAKAFGLIMSMDKMVGGQFEIGLAQLKLVAEAASRR